VLAPDINESLASFTVVPREKDGKEVIRFGLNAIKNVGGHIVEVIIEERKNNGKYKDVYDFLERIVDRDMNKKSLESLVKTGALDQFGDRGIFLANMEKLLEFNKEVSHSRDNKQASLFGGGGKIETPRPKLKEEAIANRQERLSWERELLGLYITEHPFNDYKKLLGDYTTPIDHLASRLNDENVRIAGIVMVVKKIITKSNKAMLFVKLEDATAPTEILVFPTLLEKTADLWAPGKAVICQGKVSDKDNEIKFLADKAIELSLNNIDASLDAFKKIEVKTRNNFYHNGNVAANNGYVKVPAPAAIPSGPEPLKIILNRVLTALESEKIRETMLKNNGASKVYFKIMKNNQPMIMETGFRVNNTGSLREYLKKELGEAIIVVDEK
jgi:DNA polymerase-3 subunit alpha